MNVHRLKWRRLALWCDRLAATRAGTPALLWLDKACSARVARGFEHGSMHHLASRAHHRALLRPRVLDP